MTVVDLSKWQGVVPVSTFQQWKAAGVTRVIVKIGGGDSGRYEDSCRAANMGNAEAAGLEVDGYWFNGTTDAAADAQFASSLVGPSMRIWWDAENEGSMPHWSPSQVLAARAAIPNPQGVYMSQSVTFEAGWGPVAAVLPLWVAAYFGSTVPPVGNGFQAALWQKTSTGRLPGFGGNLDLSDELANLSVLAVQPIPVIEKKDITMIIISSPNRGQVEITEDAGAYAIRPDVAGVERQAFPSHDYQNDQDVDTLIRQAWERANTVRGMQSADLEKTIQATIQAATAAAVVQATASK